MGRNAAFGRPPASERIRMWWDARSKTSRQNALLALVVGLLFVAIVMAGVARDKSVSTSRVIASRPQPTTTTLALPTPSTVNIDLGGAVTAADLFGLNTTSTAPATAPATTAPASPTTGPAPATTAAPAPATTVTNPDVIFNTVPPASTTTTLPPVSTTRPPTTTTAPPSTTTTTLSLPLSVPDLLAGG